MRKTFYLLVVVCFVFGCGERSEPTVAEKQAPPQKRKPGELYPELGLIEAVKIAQSKFETMSFDTSEYYLHSVRYQQKHWVLLWNQMITDLQVDGHIIILVDMEKKAHIDPPMRIKPRIDLGIPHEPRRLPKRGIAPSLSIFEAIKIAQAYVDSEDLYLDRVQLGKPSRLGGKNCWRVTWEKKVFTMGGNQSFFVDMHGNSGKWRPGM